MPTVPNNVDWSATAAWIALAISIITPAITTSLNNRHQLKMYKLQSAEKRIDALNDARISALESFLANTGRCVSTKMQTSLEDFSTTYFTAYQYVPESLWGELDELYDKIENDHWADARIKFKAINREITALLKETFQ